MTSGSPGAMAPEGSMRKVVLISLAGSTIEWYDFFIYGTAAALVFNQLFFPSFLPLAGTLLAFSTFAVGFVIRPVGAVIFGHLGDKFGRKPALVTAMLTMGVATTAIGLLPTFATVGVLAPIMLVTLRLIQGLALGGQWGGAVLLVTESAPSNKRGFYGSFAQLGVPAALIISNLLFLVLTLVLPSEAFAAWGWRVPFLLSILLIGVGLYLQLRVEDTPVMRRAHENHAEARSPIVDLFRNQSKAIALAAGATVINGASYYILAVYMVAYGTEILQLPRSTILTGVLLSAVASGGAILAFAALSDRVGRRKVFLSGAVLMALWAFPLFWLVDTKLTVLIAVSLIVGQVFFSMTYGPAAALFSEMFGARVRYSGVSIGYQVGSVLGGAFAPIIATSLYAAFGTSAAVSVYLIVVAAISFASVFLVTETYQTNADDVEGTEAPASSFDGSAETSNR